MLQVIRRKKTWWLPGFQVGLVMSGVEIEVKIEGLGIRPNGVQLGEAERFVIGMKGM